MHQITAKTALAGVPYGKRETSRSFELAECPALGSYPGEHLPPALASASPSHMLFPGREAVLGPRHLALSRTGPSRGRLTQLSLQPRVCAASLSRGDSHQSTPRVHQEPLWCPGLT